MKESRIQYIKVTIPLKKPPLLGVIYKPRDTFAGCPHRTTIRTILTMRLYLLFPVLHASPGTMLVRVHLLLTPSVFHRLPLEAMHTPQLLIHRRHITLLTLPAKDIVGTAQSMTAP